MTVAATLQETALLCEEARQSVQHTTAHADAAITEARRALQETETVKTSVKAALEAHLQATTQLSEQQVQQLAHSTAIEIQSALQEQKRVAEQLEVQRLETQRLQKVI